MNANDLYEILRIASKRDDVFGKELTQEAKKLFKVMLDEKSTIGLDWSFYDVKFFDNGE